MVTVSAWRIVKRRHLSTAFLGEGARLHGGRWNTPGRSVVYASQSRALAMLEVLAGLQTSRPLGAYVLVEMRFSGSLVRTVDPADLKPGWDALPPTHVSQSIGDAWLAAAESAVLRVPSVVVPEESNYLLNPTHPDFAGVEIGEAVGVTWDPRIGSRMERT